jgi:hypothetical protein
VACGPTKQHDWVSVAVDDTGSLGVAASFISQRMCEEKLAKKKSLLTCPKDSDYTNAEDNSTSAKSFCVVCSNDSRNRPGRAINSTGCSELEKAQKNSHPSMGGCKAQIWRVLRRLGAPRLPTAEVLVGQQKKFGFTL